MSALRDVAISAAASRPFSAAVAAADRLPGPPALTVLMYHEIAAAGDEPAVSPGTVSATPEEFARQMRFVADRRRGVSLADVLAARDGSPLPPRAVLVTFDDAYGGFARHAWPVMRDLGIPATLFVATGFADRPRAFWWDRLWRAVATTPSPADTYRELRATVKGLPHDEAMHLVDETVRRLGVDDDRPDALGWDALRDLHREGVTLAAHSVDHPLLTRVTPDRAAEEIRGSIEALEREVGAAPPAFAYPAGAYDPGVVAAADAAGCRVAFTTERGTNRIDRCRWLALRRVNIGGRARLPLVRAQALPVAGVVGRWSGPTPERAY